MKLLLIIFNDQHAGREDIVLVRDTMNAVEAFKAYLDDDFEPKWVNDEHKAYYDPDLTVRFIDTDGFQYIDQLGTYRGDQR